MLNFEVLKARVKAHAVDAARSIRNFDDMAAQDEYIHSADLRTPESRWKDNETARRNAPPPSLAGNATTVTRKSTKTNASDVLNQATAFSSLLGDSDDPTIDQQVLLVVDEPAKEKTKKPNRFMDDLSERLSKTEEGNDRVQIKTASLRIDDPEHTTQPPPLWNSWSVKTPVLANVLSRFQSPPVSTNKPEEMRPMVGPLSARKVQEEDHGDVESQYTDDMDDSTNDFVLRSSISVLGADERAALDRMRTSSEPITTTLASILQNPHFAFILVTLILGSAAYFYSRHKEQIDDVT
jgi:hypothetical protein